MKTILIVEDEKIIAMDYQLNLKKKGYNVIRTVDNGKDAIKAAINENPGIILMDISLKGDLNGIETAKEISRHCDTTVIFISAFIDEYDKDFGIKSVFLRKPVTSSDILQMVNRVEIGIMNLKCRVKKSEFSEYGECLNTERNNCVNGIFYEGKVLCTHYNWKELLAIENSVS